MGPISLGMSSEQAIAKLGAPDKEASSAATYRDFIYVFPRDLAARLKRHPLPEAKVDYGYMEVVFHGNAAITISSTVRGAPAIFPYSVGGIAIGDQINNLLGRLPTAPAWNTSHDHVELYPYPIGLDVHPADGKIAGILITTSTKPVPGHAIRFQWTRSLATGLIDGFYIEAGPSP